MKKNKTIVSLVFILLITYSYASNPNGAPRAETQILHDSLRLVELNTFWNEVSRTVHEGDFEGYKATYHEDAVVVFTTGEKKISMPITKALVNWKQDFIDTKSGKTQNSVEFRFLQRVGDETTAHETGIFSFRSNDGTGNESPKQYIHFDALLVKRGTTWLMVMEYQKTRATKEEWALLD